MHGDIGHYVVTTIRHEMTLGLPSDFSEIGKFFAIVQAEWNRQHPGMENHDDTFTISSVDDEQMVISWAEEIKREPFKREQFVPSAPVEPVEHEHWTHARLLREIRKYPIVRDQVLVYVNIPKDRYNTSELPEEDQERETVPAGSFGSYRGYYEQMALSASSDEPRASTVEHFIDLMEEADGAEHQSWKSGLMTIHGSSPLWVANEGETGGHGVTGFHMEGSEKLVIDTAYFGF